MRLEEMTEDGLYLERKRLRELLGWGGWRFAQNCQDKPEMAKRLSDVQEQLDVVRFGEALLY